MNLTMKKTFDRMDYLVDKQKIHYILVEVDEQNKQNQRYEDEYIGNVCHVDGNMEIGAKGWGMEVN